MQIVRSLCFGIWPARHEVAASCDRNPGTRRNAGTDPKSHLRGLSLRSVRWATDRVIESAHAVGASATPRSRRRVAGVGAVPWDMTIAEIELRRCGCRASTSSSEQRMARGRTTRLGSGRNDPLQCIPRSLIRPIESFARLC